MIISASQYHHHTSYQRDQMDPHYLDWQNQPGVFKDYAGISPILLPSDLKLPETKLSSILRGDEIKDREKDIDVKDLSLILRLACSLTAKARSAGGDHYFRSVASAGALYPTEVYVAANSVKGIDDGLYHFAIHRNCLYPLREGDLSRYLAGVLQNPEDHPPALVFFLTAIFFRSAWKYRDRSYRYHLMDTGHLAENLTLGLKAFGLPFNLSYDFDDDGINYLLGLDEKKEVSLAILQAGGNRDLSGSSDHSEEIGELPQARKNASRVSSKEIDYPALGEIHRAGISILSVEGGKTEILRALGVHPRGWRKNRPPRVWPEIMNYPEAISNRRSKRNFVREPIKKDQMAALIDSLCIRKFTDSMAGAEYHNTISVGFLAGNMEETSPGFYLLDQKKESLGLVLQGSFMEAMAHICLDQAWLANSALHFLFLTNLEIIDSTWGARGYRYAMMTAGRLGQRLYLAATAMGMGCCGIGAFYDEEAVDLLGINEESRLLYLVAIGPVKG